MSHFGGHFLVDQGIILNLLKSLSRDGLSTWSIIVCLALYHILVYIKFTDDELWSNVTIQSCFLFYFSLFLQYFEIMQNGFCFTVIKIIRFFNACLNVLCAFYIFLFCFYAMLSYLSLRLPLGVRVHMWCWVLSHGDVQDMLLLLLLLAFILSKTLVVNFCL